MLQDQQPNLSTGYDYYQKKKKKSRGADNIVIIGHDESTRSGRGLIIQR